MNAHLVGISVVRAWAYLLVLLTVGACQIGPGREITSTKPYVNFIGAKYSVIGDEVYAYGVYEGRDENKLGYVTLVPPPGIAGPEFAFRRIVPKNQVMTILSVWRRFIPLENGIYYRVEIENLDFPPGIPVRLELARGNQGVGGDLNPALYRKLPKDNRQKYEGMTVSQFEAEVHRFSR